ncbi:hypothetical protein [Billgrantia antri]|uniref:Uncharacterized protein n=1 Tax=Billgrantia antri TaxID=2846777 RepID=A0ABS6ZJF8_9GAMM|nr:hypothetical protein [Halomonas antri]MBW6390208.1 hypothetical protein [Halomonas antri]
MTTITRNSLAQAAQEGTGIAHLSPGQAWAAHRLAMPPERLEKPLAPHIAALLENVERVAARKFFASTDRDDTESIIRVAHDEAQPMFLRAPILQTLRQGMVECLPDLTPSGVNDKGEPVYRLAKIAAALDVPEEELLARAEAMGLKDKLSTTPHVHPLH